MATISYGIPGIGGSLGKCAICGESFAREIMLGESIPFIRCNLVDANLPAHKKCADAIQSLSGSWKTIRDAFPDGPMKNAIEQTYSNERKEDILG